MEKLKILVVDDDTSNLALAQKLLGKDSFKGSDKCPTKVF